jgi:hypothetical protein
MLDSGTWFRGSLHERAMLAVVHCTVTAMLNEASMASQIDFDRNAEQLN